MKDKRKRRRKLMERKCYPDQALTVYWLLDSSLLSLFLFSDSQEPIVNDIILISRFFLIFIVIQLVVVFQSLEILRHQLLTNIAKGIPVYESIKI